MPLRRVLEPFDDPDWLFEVKYDGFRALAYVQDGSARLVSRKDHVYTRFGPLTADLARLSVNNTVLDGEIVCLDDGGGRPQFYDLLFRRTEPYFYAFDVLWLNGRDLRQLPLVQREEILRGVIGNQSSRILYAGSHPTTGTKLFSAACRMDLEGIVAKPKNSVYGAEPSCWFKIKNAGYIQAVGRHELFRARSA